MGCLWELPPGVKSYVDTEDNDKVVEVVESSVESSSVPPASLPEPTAGSVEAPPPTPTPTSTLTPATSLAFLSTKDAVLDPSCMSHVAAATSSGASQTEVVNTLIKSYSNIPGEVALLAGWLKELQGNTAEHKSSVVGAVVESVQECLLER